MDFAEKGDLLNFTKEYRNKKKYIPEEIIWDILSQVSKGLRDLHSKKILHRDIKCANIFLHNDNKVRIGDLNVSKLQKHGYAKTQTGTPY